VRPLPGPLRKALTMEDTIAGIVAALLIIYLLWTLIRPEKF
jgi:K+-transporting ATPase KdpF subunit